MAGRPRCAALLVAAACLAGCTGSQPTAPTTTASTAATTTPSTAATTTPSTAAPTVSRQRGDLVGYWVLTDLHGFNGAAHTAPDARLTFRFYPNGAMSQGCLASRAIVRTGTLKFVQGWLAGNTYCPRLGVHQSLFLLGRVLTGSARWVIRDTTLTVRNGDVSAAFHREAGEPRPKPTSASTQ